MQTKTVDVREMQARLAELLSLVIAGTEVILTEGNVPRARIVPFLRDSTSTSRIAGLHQGKIQTSSDFDEPLSDPFWTLSSQRSL